MRYILSHVVEDLKRKMVFIGGPRQVGKTTLARHILKTAFTSGRYFNWDYDQDRSDIHHQRWSDDDQLLVFDELHKYPRWKRWIKGIFDVEGSKHSLLVTGSARLDLYRKGGDSLMGRYHYWRLHPFTLDEIPMGITRKLAFERLITVGGFPEPFLGGDERAARRWRRERLDRVLREDIRDLENVRDIQLLGLFLEMLRERVGSSIVMANIAQDLEVAPKTIKSWLALLERMYLIFIVPPYTRSLARAIRKPPKVYFYDNGDVRSGEGERFENLVAASILKRLHFLEDQQGYRYELRYLRDKEGREVDFVILKEGNIEELIEVKFAETNVSRSLQYYAERLSPRRATQIVAHLRNPYSLNQLKITDAMTYFDGFFNAKGE